jgi:WD40 repeat protein
VRVWRLADGDPDRFQFGPVTSMAVGALPDGTPVIVYGDGDGTARVWRLADGARFRDPHGGHDGVMSVAVGALPDGTPVIVAGGVDGTVRVWRLADGAPVGDPHRGHDGPVTSVAVGALPDGTPVIVSGGDDGTVRVWRLADGTSLTEPLRVGAPISSVAMSRGLLIAATERGLAAVTPALIANDNEGSRDSR